MKAFVLSRSELDNANNFTISIVMENRLVKLIHDRCLEIIVTLSYDKHPHLGYVVPYYPTKARMFNMDS